MAFVPECLTEYGGDGGVVVEGHGLDDVGYLAGGVGACLEFGGAG